MAATGSSGRSDELTRSLGSVAPWTASSRWPSRLPSPPAPDRTGSPFVPERAPTTSTLSSASQGSSRTGALLNELREMVGRALASWLVEEPNEALTHVLVNDGWTPERCGRWCGRLLHHGPHVRAASGPKDMTVVRVATDDDLEQWLDVASACGWFEGRHDRMTRRDLMRGAAGDPLGASWLARLVDRPVGMVRGWVSGPYVEIVDVAVRHSAQRRGVGTALVSSVLAWGATKGAREVVAAPSPDGWSLFDALAFTNVPVTPDVCFYWSGEGGSPNRS